MNNFCSLIGFFPNQNQQLNITLFGPHIEVNLWENHFCIIAAYNILIPSLWGPFRISKMRSTLAVFEHGSKKNHFPLMSHKLYWIFPVPNIKTKIFCQMNFQFTLWKKKQFSATMLRCTSHFWQIVMALESLSGFSQRGPFGPVVSQCSILSSRSSLAITKSYSLQVSVFLIVFVQLHFCVPLEQVMTQLSMETSTLTPWNHETKYLWVECRIFLLLFDVLPIHL